MAGLLTNVLSSLAQFGFDEVGGKLERSREEEERIRQAEALNGLLQAVQQNRENVIAGEPTTVQQFHPDILSLNKSQTEQFAGPAFLQGQEATGQEFAEFQDKKILQNELRLKAYTQLFGDVGAAQEVVDGMDTFAETGKFPVNMERLNEMIGKRSEAGVAGDIKKIPIQKEADLDLISARTQGQIAVKKTQGGGQVGDNQGETKKLNLGQASLLAQRMDKSTKIESMNEVISQTDFPPFVIREFGGEQQTRPMTRKEKEQYVLTNPKARLDYQVKVKEKNQVKIANFGKTNQEQLRKFMNSSAGPATRGSDLDLEDVGSVQSEARQQMQAEIDKAAQQPGFDADAVRKGLIENNWNPNDFNIP